MALLFELTRDTATSCSLWIDLRTFPMPPAKNVAIIGLTLNQVQFAQADFAVCLPELPSLPQVSVKEDYPGSTTVFYYKHHSLLVARYITPSMRSIIESKYPHSMRLRADEDGHATMARQHYDTRTYPADNPVGVISQMIHQHPNGERVIVYRPHRSELCLAQYRYRDDNQLLLGRRLQTLLHCEGDVTLSNASVRTMFNIPH